MHIFNFYFWGRTRSYRSSDCHFRAVPFLLAGFDDRLRTPLDFTHWEFPIRNCAERYIKKSFIELRKTVNRFTYNILVLGSESFVLLRITRPGNRRLIGKQGMRCHYESAVWSARRVRLLFASATTNSAWVNLFEWRGRKAHCEYYVRRNCIPRTHTRFTWICNMHRTMQSRKL